MLDARVQIDCVDGGNDIISFEPAMKKPVLELVRVVQHAGARCLQREQDFGQVLRSWFDPCASHGDDGPDADRVLVDLGAKAKFANGAAVQLGPERPRHFESAGFLCDGEIVVC